MKAFSFFSNLLLFQKLKSISSQSDFYPYIALISKSIFNNPFGALLEFDCELTFLNKGTLKEYLLR